MGLSAHIKLLSHSNELSKPPDDLNPLPLYRTGMYIQEGLGVAQIQVEFAGSNGTYTPKSINVPEAYGGNVTERSELIQGEGFQLIIAAAGEGTRMGELTQDTPKPLLSIHQTPVLTKLVKAFNQAIDVTSISVIMNPAKRSYKDRFLDWKQNFPDVNLYQQETGTANNQRGY